jgi:hypothetical protein
MSYVWENPDYGRDEPDVCDCGRSLIGLCEFCEALANSLCPDCGKLALDCVCESLIVEGNQCSTMTPFDM